MDLSNDFAFVVTVVNNNFERLYICIDLISRLYPNCNVDIIVDNFLQNVKNKKNNIDLEEIKNVVINNCKNPLNIEIYETVLKYPFVSFNHKDRCLYQYSETTKYKYLAIIDDDTFLINKGLIEWCMKIMDINKDIGMITEVLKPWYSGLNCGKNEKMLERVSNWFMFVNTERLKENDIHFSTYDKEKFINYLEDNLTLSKKRNLNPTRDDCGFIYYQLKKSNLKIIDLNQYIFFYQEHHAHEYPDIPKEFFISNGNASLNYYYIHAGSLWFFIKDKNEKRRDNISEYLSKHKSLNLHCYDNLDEMGTDCW